MRKILKQKYQPILDSSLYSSHLLRISLLRITMATSPHQSPHKAENCKSQMEPSPGTSVGEREDQCVWTLCARVCRVNCSWDWSWEVARLLDRWGWWCFGRVFWSLWKLTESEFIREKNRNQRGKHVGEESITATAFRQTPFYRNSTVHPGKVVSVWGISGTKNM